jgi:hypothetical protein
MRRLLGVFAAIAAMVVVQAVQADSLSDAQIRKMMIHKSIAAYPGSCPCPYNLASNGSECGGRSAWSRAGGYAPLCYASDISDEMVRQYRQQNGMGQ